MYNLLDANALAAQELKVMKVKEADGSKCLILPLNRSDNALPDAVLDAAVSVSFSFRLFSSCLRHWCMFMR